MQKYLNVQDWLETNARLLYAPGSTTDPFAITQSDTGESRATKKRNHLQMVETGYPRWEFGGSDNDVIRAVHRTLLDQVLQNSSDLPERIEHYLDLSKKLRDTPPVEHDSSNTAMVSIVPPSGAQCALRQEKKAKRPGIPDDMKSWLPALSRNENGNMTISVPKATMDYATFSDSKKLLRNLSALSEGANRNEDFTQLLQDAVRKYYPQAVVTFSHKQNLETREYEPAWNVSIGIAAESKDAARALEKRYSPRVEPPEVAEDWLRKTAEIYAAEPSGPKDMAKAKASIADADSGITRRIAITTLGNFDYARDIRVEHVSTETIELSFNTEIAEKLVTRARSQAQQR